ncbi:NUDIX domain-containing protein [bacterium]|nr:NUDIX domain-containing protein [bacterium]
MSTAQERLPRIRLGGVVVQKGKLLVVKHHRAGKEYFLLPGGGLEWGETCEAGLAREFMEELSLEIKVGSLLFINESIAPRGKRHILNLTFYARLQGGRLHLNPDRRLKGVCWVTPAELKQLTFYPEIREPILSAWKKRFKPVIKLVDTPWF